MAAAGYGPVTYHQDPILLHYGNMSAYSGLETPAVGQETAFPTFRDAPLAGYLYKQES